MRNETGVQELLDSLHDAVVNGVWLEGADLVLEIHLVVGWVPDPEAPRLPEAPNALPHRLVFQPHRLVFEGFQGPMPRCLKGRSLELVEAKDGAYLLVTEALQECQECVVRAGGLRLEAVSPPEEACRSKQEGGRP